MEVISVHRALSQLKTTKSRIDKISSQVFVTYTKGQSELALGKPIESVNTQITANYDSAIQLIKNYQEIKLAIIRNNSGITDETTNIQKFDVLGEKYTIAEIIAIQSYVLPIYKDFINILTNEYNQVQSKIESQNQSNDTNTDRIIAAITGKSPDAKISSNEFNAIADVYRKNNQYTLVDPISIETRITELTDLFDKMTVAIDSALSEANALNKITVNI